MSDNKESSMSVEGKVLKEANCLMHLQQHLRNMLTDETYADVKLRAGGENFFAHKCVLSNRSPVFRAMFHQDMLESKTGVIDIHDVEPKILKFFLEYLYTGAVEGMNCETALSLLVVADKYQVSPLTQKCSTFLKFILSYDNVLNVLQIADMLNQEGLKMCAIEYIVENSTQVLSSPDWQYWVQKNTTIASEVFLELSKKFDSMSKNKEEPLRSLQIIQQPETSILHYQSVSCNHPIPLGKSLSSCHRSPLQSSPLQSSLH